ncbi:MAG: hypothetical protein ACK4NS_06460, partial [Saprospiraceae bacterium]
MTRIFSLHQIQWRHALALIYGVSALISITSCNKDDDKRPLSVPSSYDGAQYASRTATQYAVRGQLNALVAACKKGRTQGVTLSFDTLNNLYATAGAPTLKSIATPYYDGQLSGPNGWLAELAKASGGTYTPGPPTGGQGGVFGPYLFDENGLEIEQLVEKGLFGAALYNHAVSLMQGEITEATVDQLVAIFGAHPDFPNTPTAAKAANPDAFMANYAARRDKNDGAGLYSQIKRAFIKLQAAVKAGPDYRQERDEALAEISLLWEKINFATVINYSHTVIRLMSNTNPTDAEKASALHSYGEAVGFTHGWRTIPASYRRITDAQIDQILTLLNASPNTTPASYLFISSPVSQLPKAQDVIALLKGIY